jgi:thymidylate kinase
MADPASVALEGANGTGKTYLARRAAGILGPGCHLVAELPDSPQAGLAGQVIAALGRHGDPFLRSGVPRTETLLLAALQVHRHESLPGLAAGTVVLEDRSPLSVAVYQAVILHPGDQRAALATADRLLALISQWRPPPDRVLLLADDPRRCQGRFAQRESRPATSGELELMTAAARLYELIAARDPRALTILDRRVLDEEACTRAIVAACQGAVAQRAASRTGGGGGQSHGPRRGGHQAAAGGTW